MADYHYARSETWSELRTVHDRFFADYNLQAHFAHQHRRDGKRSPAEVLGWVHGVWCDDAELDRLFRLRSARVFDHGGYLRYKRWRIYGDQGLHGRRGEVWLFGEVLTVAYDEDAVAQYQVAFVPRTRQIAALTAGEHYATTRSSPQPYLWDLSDLEWHHVQRLPPYRPRRSHDPPDGQLWLLP